MAAVGLKIAQILDGEPVAVHEQSEEGRDCLGEGASRRRRANYLSVEPSFGQKVGALRKQEGDLLSRRPQEFHPQSDSVDFEAPELEEAMLAALDSRRHSVNDELFDQIRSGVSR